MPILHDEEFGKITIRRSARATQIRLRVAPDGTLRASMPPYAPLFLVKRLIKTSRLELRSLLDQSTPKTVYQDGMAIGKSHHLHVQYNAGALRAVRQKQQIIVWLPTGLLLTDPSVTSAIRTVIIAALRIEAKSYLPKRLAYIAKTHGFTYQKIRFSHASGRWGSCSSQGTISLNIALMKLPFELIDYVLVHELSHTHHMNHSPEFWQLVAQADPQYRLHRRALKEQTPSI